MDITELQAPVAVYKLAEEKDRREIVALLRSDEPLTRWTRDALADWLEGKPVRKKRGRGRPKRYKENPWEDSLLKIAENDYRRYAAFLKKRGKFHGKANKLAEALAKKWLLEPERFLNYLKRSKKTK